MRKTTAHVQQLQKMYSLDNGRLQGEAGWEKFPLFWFILFLSYQCTRKCRYCYALNQAGVGRQRLEMDEDTFAVLLDWIPDVWRQNNVKVNIVNFLGGEPLLRTDRIRKVMDVVYSHTDGMQGLVNTNADLVDTVNWDDLESIQWMTVNIADTSLEELARRMNIIRQRSNVINQTIAATLDEVNLERVVDIARFGMENGYRLRFYKNLFAAPGGEYHRKLLKKYHEVVDLLENYIARGVNVHTTFLFDILIPSWDLPSSPYPCGRRLAVVFPDGKIGPCIRNHGFTTGTILDPDPLRRLQCAMFHYDGTRSDLPEDCRNCPSRGVCQGGCPNDKLLVTGNSAGRSVACDLHREIIPRLQHLDSL
ncbi:MAG TPA: SPASM domain-containing protein, partial [Desulfoprunum sp.]|nr:SPASM domain-containing protein [Desulfoprunum sp.]